MLSEKTIRKLIRIVEESDIESLEVSTWGRKIRITQRLNGSTNGSGPVAVYETPAPSPKAAPAAAPPSPQPQATVPAESSDTDTSGMVEIKSPMVGTFYAAPSPDADAYVSLNEKINVGQVVCIIEAMKLMNEIEAEVGGRIVKIMAENAKPVEFGQVLFLVDPKG